LLFIHFERSEVSVAPGKRILFVLVVFSSKAYFHHDVDVFHGVLLIGRSQIAVEEVGGAVVSKAIFVICVSLQVLWLSLYSSSEEKYFLSLQFNGLVKEGDAELGGDLAHAS